MTYPNLEITRLRKEGKLQEAIKYGEEVLKSYPDNIWVKKALSWVYYDYAKNNLESDIDEFVEYIKKIINLRLYKDEKILFESLGFLIGNKVFQIVRQENYIIDHINDLFDLVKQIPVPRPSDAYSFLFKAFHKAYKEKHFYLDFADWWNFDNFQPHDYEPREWEGKKMISVVEQAYVNYAKHLLEIDPFVNDKEQWRKSIEDFIPKLEKIIKTRPEYKFTLYAKVKLLLALQRKEEALKVLISFLKRNANIYWVWKLVAELVADNNLKKSCYCKVLSLNVKEKYTRGIHFNLAKLFLESGEQNRAKAELLKYVEISQKENLKISRKVLELMNQDWFEKTKAAKNDLHFYEECARFSNRLFFYDLPEKTIIITHVNHNKKIANFLINSTNKNGFFNYGGIIDKIKIGDVYKVKMQPIGYEGFYRIYEASVLPETTQVDALKVFDGNIKITSSGFGFVGNVFIDNSLIFRHRLQPNDWVSGKAVKSFDKKKQKWGWRAIKIFNKDEVF